MTPYMPVADEQGAALLHRLRLRSCAPRRAQMRCSPVLIAHVSDETLRDAIRRVDSDPMSRRSSRSAPIWRWRGSPRPPSSGWRSRLWRSTPRPIGRHCAATASPTRSTASVPCWPGSDPPCHSPAAGRQGAAPRSGRHTANSCGVRSLAAGAGAATPECCGKSARSEAIGGTAGSLPTFRGGGR